MKYSEALNRCLKLCSSKEYCVNDISEKLSEWDLPKATVSEVLNVLIREKYIDNNRYAYAYAHDKFSFNHWGKVKIKFHLKQKKIEGETIQKALDAIDERAYEQAIIIEINKKKKTVMANTDFERNGKIARSVIAKGFEPEKVFRVLKMDL
jgi:regulatory protein